ncbi:MAG: filamentous hemagglutinin N-terminal domain-containing protein [Candidatus Symbiobacter sp.]|nr:filamentous hemagglutinin N-terminal domain-containing protein [Candidatus Symbiobacter sp.]
MSGLLGQLEMGSGVAAASTAHQKQNRQNLKTNKYHRKLWASTALILGIGGVGLIHPVGTAQAAPTGGMVSQGAASIARTGMTTTINQATPRAVIDWDGFDVGGDENVIFNLPHNGATLNQIAGPQSQILGNVTSNGTLYFVNPNGFVFGPQSSVTAKNMVISTQTIDTDHFMASNRRENIIFNPVINKAATISLRGAIEMQDRGVLGIFAPQIDVADSAVLLVRYGKIALAGGAVTTVDFGGDGLINFELGDMLDAVSVKNAGNIGANGGQIIMTAKGGKNLFNAVVENTGTLSTRSVTNESGTVTLTAENGTASLGKSGFIDAGDHGRFIYHQNNRTQDLRIDQDFLQQINYQPGMDLEFSSGRDLLVQAALQGDGHNHLTLRAVRDLNITHELVAAGIELVGGYVFDNQNVKVGHDGLAVTANGKNQGAFTPGIVFKQGQSLGTGRPKLAASQGGDISLTANNGVMIEIDHDIEANNIYVTTDAGTIRLYGKLAATNDDGKISTIKVMVKRSGGSIDFYDQLTASNIHVYSDKGTIRFAKKITLNMVDPNPRFIHDEDRVKIAPPATTDMQGGEISVISKEFGNIVFNQEAEITGRIKHTIYDRRANGELFSVSTFDANSLPNIIGLSTTGGVFIAPPIGVREGGSFNVFGFLMRYSHITANNANIGISLYGRDYSQVIEFSHIGLYKMNVDMLLDNRISFANAQSAYFNVPGTIYVAEHYYVQKLTLHAINVDFDWANFRYQCPDGCGSIAMAQGGSLTIWQRNSLDFNGDYTKYWRGLGGVNLTLKSDRDLTITSPLNAGPDKNITLAGKNITLNADVSSQNGKITLEYLNKGAKEAANFNQATANHLVFWGKAVLAVKSAGNLTVSGHIDHLFEAEYIAQNNGKLTIDTDIQAQHHLGLYGDGSIVINQNVSTKDGGEPVLMVTPNNQRFLSFGKNGRVGLAGEQSR